MLKTHSISIPVEMGKPYPEKTAHRTVQITAAKDRATHFRFRMSQLSEIGNCQTVLSDGNAPDKPYVSSRQAIFGDYRTPPREPEEFERKYVALVNQIPAQINKATLEVLIDKAQALYDAHVCITDERKIKHAPVLETVAA